MMTMQKIVQNEVDKTAKAIQSQVISGIAFPKSLYWLYRNMVVA